MGDHVAAADEVRYPFPLRPGVTAWLTLPPDLTLEEANRLGAYVSTLVMPEANGADE